MPMNVVTANFWTLHTPAQNTCPNSGLENCSLQAERSKDPESDFLIDLPDTERTLYLNRDPDEERALHLDRYLRVRHGLRPARHAPRILTGTNISQDSDGGMI